MSFQFRPGQEQVLEATEPVVVVLGGAGTGKTSTAAAAVRIILDDACSTRRSPKRALFLSFSRAAVAQTIDRASDVLGPQAKHVETTTFHAFAWQLIKRWGTAIGISEPTLTSPSEAKIFGTENGITYGDLLPLSIKLLRIPAIRMHLQRRWAVIVSDEFQDTSEEQFELISLIRGNARLLLLGDLNQCIYTNLPGVTGVGLQRIRAALTLPGARKIVLPEASHRDPTNILPAAANAIRERNFTHEAVSVALKNKMLEVHRHLDLTAEGDLVTELVARLQNEGYESVGIFSHHIDATTSLSDYLNKKEISHEIVGLPDSITSALQAQFEMLRIATGQAHTDAHRRSLAIFVTSTVRGQRVPELARMIAGQSPVPLTLDTRLRQFGEQLKLTSSISEILEIISTMPDGIGLVQGQRPWEQANIILRNLLGPRICRAATMSVNDLDSLGQNLTNEHAALLTYDNYGETNTVKLMGLYQSKGREADATIVVFRGTDYFGKEPEPWLVGSKLLYVLLTRAKTKTIVLLVGAGHQPLIAPLARLAWSSGA